MLALYYLKLLSRSHQRRVLMTRIGSHQFAGGKLKDPQPYSKEHILLIVFTDGFICSCQYLCRRIHEHRRVLDHDLGSHHEQSSGNSLSGHVGHDHAEMIFINQKEVVEVSSHLSGRFYRCVYLEFISVRIRRENAGHHGQLDPLGHIQF